jgi:hypothetical protein
VSTLLDAWRAIDPGARLVSGAVIQLSRQLRGVARTRAIPPHLPPLSSGQLLVVDGGVLPAGGLDAFIGAVREAGLEPAGLWLVSDRALQVEPADDDLPVLVGSGSATARTADVTGYLDAEAERLADIAAGLRLAAAEAALADPRPAAPAGVVAARLRRGVAIGVDGVLASLNPRPAGRALATRFAATHARLLGTRATSPDGARRTREGLWILERPIAPNSTAWLFDDLPFARVDAVALDALAVTMRALLRRPPTPARSRGEPRLPPSSGDALRDTLLAVARANGRVAPAARALGVHRNTVLYRLRNAAAELGIDPRRPEDALRLLEEAGPHD